MQSEQWKTIIGFEGCYQVSDLGRVRSLDRMVRSCHGSLRLEHGQILKPSLDKDGYVCVSLCKDGKRHNYKVHRLTATAFLDNTEQKPQVNHKDGIKAHNCVSNLEWATSAEDAEHRTANDLQARGSRHAAAN